MKCTGLLGKTFGHKFHKSYLFCASIYYTKPLTCYRCGYIPSVEEPTKHKGEVQ